MDYIILNNDGSLQKSSLDRYIQQGNHGVDKIFIGYANGLATDIAQAVFTLPNQTTNTELGEYQLNYNYDGEHTINGWLFTLTNAQTLYNGLLMTSIRIIRNGIVQVAYPFTLVINETGVRPEDDSGLTIEQIDSYLLNLQNLVTVAVQNNTDSNFSNTSENPVQNKVITNAFETLKRGSYTKVDTTEYPTLQDFLDSEGEEGYLYLYPVDVNDEDEGYYQYIWENDMWIPLGTTKIDISNMATTDTAQTISGAKTLTKKLSFTIENNNSFIECGTFKATLDGNGKPTVGQNNNEFRFYDSNIRVASTLFRPQTTNNADLGSSDYKWKDAYFAGAITTVYIGNANATPNFYFAAGSTIAYKTIAPNISLTGTLNLGSSSATWKDFYLDGYIYLGLGIKANADNDINFYISTANYYRLTSNMFRPMSDNVRDLGMSTLRWKDLYLGGNLSDGTNSIAVKDIGKKLYQHNISSTGADFTNASLIIVTTSATALTSVLNIDLLLNGTSVVSALIIDMNGLYTPIIKYAFNGIAALDFNFVDISGGALALGTKTLSDSDTITDTVTAL